MTARIESVMSDEVIAELQDALARSHSSQSNSPSKRVLPMTTHMFGYADNTLSDETIADLHAAVIEQFHDFPLSDSMTESDFETCVVPVGKALTVERAYLVLGEQLYNHVCNFRAQARSVKYCELDLNRTLNYPNAGVSIEMMEDWEREEKAKRDTLEVEDSRDNLLRQNKVLENIRRSISVILWHLQQFPVITRDQFEEAEPFYHNHRCTRELMTANEAASSLSIVDTYHAVMNQAKQRKAEQDSLNS
jgi:hypothetical protein